MKSKSGKQIAQQQIAQRSVDDAYLEIERLRNGGLLTDDETENAFVLYAWAAIKLELLLCTIYRRLNK